MAQQDFGAEFDTVRNSAAFRLAYEEQLVRNVRCLTISQYADEVRWTF